MIYIYIYIYDLLQNTLKKYDGGISGNTLYNHITKTFTI